MQSMEGRKRVSTSELYNISRVKKKGIRLKSRTIVSARDYRLPVMTETGYHPVLESSSSLSMCASSLMNFNSISYIPPL